MEISKPRSLRTKRDCIWFSNIIKLLIRGISQPKNKSRETSSTVFRCLFSAMATSFKGCITMVNAAV